MTGVWLGMKVCAPALAESGKSSRHGSAIVNLASIAGIVGSLLDPLYSMTKGGVTLFTKSTALFFGRKGWRIRVNSIYPGGVGVYLLVAASIGALGSGRSAGVRSRANDLI